MMTRKGAAIAIGAIVCLSWPIVALANPLAQYGPGTLTQQQSNILIRRELAYPQTYGAIVSKFGYPSDSDDFADRYKLADGRDVAIVYVDGTAVYAEGL